MGENGEQIIQLNRLYSIMADSYETYQYVCGAPELTYVPASQLAAPKFNLKLGPFYLSGNGVYDDSNECNWVNNGKGDRILNSTIRAKTSRALWPTRPAR